MSSPSTTDTVRFAKKITTRLSRSISTYNSGDVVDTWSDREKAIIDLLRLSFRHGLKPTLTNVLLPVLGTESTFWPVAKSLCHQNTINYLRSMRKKLPVLKEGDKEMENAWLVTALNEACLLEYIRMLRNNKKLIDQYYKDKESVMRNEEAINMIVDACMPLTKLVFSLRLEDYPQYLTERRERKGSGISIHSIESSVSLTSSVSEISGLEEESLAPSISKKLSSAKEERKEEEEASLVSELPENEEAKEQLPPLPLLMIPMRRRPSLLSQLLANEEQVKEGGEEQVVAETASSSSIASLKREDKGDKVEESIPPPEIEKTTFFNRFLFGDSDKKQPKKEESEEVESIPIHTEKEEMTAIQEPEEQPKGGIPLASVLFGYEGIKPIKEEEEEQKVNEPEEQQEKEEAQEETVKVEPSKPPGFFGKLFGRREGAEKEEEEITTKTQEGEEAQPQPSKEEEIEPQQPEERKPGLFGRLFQSREKSRIDEEEGETTSPLSEEEEEEEPEAIDIQEAETEPETTPKVGFFGKIFGTTLSSPSTDLEEGQETQETHEEPSREEKEAQEELYTESKEEEAPSRAGFFNRIFGGTRSGQEEDEEGERQVVEPEPMPSHAVEPQGYFGRYFGEHADYQSPSLSGPESEMKVDKAKEDLLDIIQQIKVEAPIQEIKPEEREDIHSIHSPLESIDEREFYMIKGREAESTSSDLGVLVLPGQAFRNIITSLPLFQLLKWLLSRPSSSSYPSPAEGDLFSFLEHANRGDPINDSNPLVETHQLELRLCPIKGLNAQSFGCESCGKTIGIGSYEPAKLCQVTGYYYCKDCHLDEEYYSPAEILNNWDFTKVPIAHNNLKAIKERSSTELFDLERINPYLSEYVNEVKECKSQREKLVEINKIIKDCTKYDTLIEEIKDRKHLVESTNTYTIDDMIGLKNNELNAELETLNKKLTDHMTSKCESCKNHLVKSEH